jgi:hypothetical protein
MLKLSNRATLSILLILAPFLWGALLLYTRFIPPHTLLAFTAFFLLIGIAITSTFAPIAYFIGLRFLSSRLYRTTVRHALRQGVLLSLCIVLNLILLSLHSWNIFAAIIIFAAAIVIEIISMGRK